MADSDGTEHERLPESWVQRIEEGWELTRGPDELARIRSEPVQPIDEFLHAISMDLMQLGNQMLYGVDSYKPLDEKKITEDGRELVREAFRKIGDARGLISQAVGVERMTELTNQVVDEIIENALEDPDDD